MANNFKILPRQKKGTLHINLSGDFDGSSAYVLINYLRENCNPNLRRILIYTCGLSNIYPFGSHMFRKNLYLLHQYLEKIVILGTNKSKLDLEPEP